MILGTPDFFPIKRLDQLGFGGVEASDDELLEQCICEIDPIKEFLRGKTNIVLGERGTGKSALFRMLSNGWVQFENPKGKTPLLLAIDEDIQYKTLRDQIISKIQVTTKDEKLRYRFTWEMFILYKILSLLKDEHQMDDVTITTLKNDFDVALGFEKRKVGLMQFLLSHKKSVGVKLDTFHPSQSTFYVAAEPPEQELVPPEQISQIDLVRAKREISKILNKNNMTLYVILDRLDDFAVLEEYDSQKVILEGLLACQMSYTNVPEIKIRLFLRSDLFLKLDFTQLGLDKIRHKTVELIWRAEDIREFMARRLAYNFMTALQLKNLIFQTDRGELHLDPALKAKAEAARSRHGFIGYFQYLFFRAKKRFHIRGRINNRHARRVNFNDAINRELITLIFPTNVLRATALGQVAPLNIFDFLETHLSLASKFTTPRIVISFLEKALREARHYYAANHDIQSIPKNSTGEYPLILMESVKKAYQDLKNEAWEICAKVSLKWEQPIYELRAKLAKKEQFEFRDFAKVFSQMKKEELHQFIAFLTHIGLLSCDSPHRLHAERAYSLPLMFRETW